MSQQRRGGLGRGLAALIPTGPEDGPTLGDVPASRFLAPGGEGPRTPPRRSRRFSGEGDEQRDGAAAGAGRVAEPAPHPEGEEPGAASDAVSRETAPADETVSRETTSFVDPGAGSRELSPAEIER